MASLPLESLSNMSFFFVPKHLQQRSGWSMSQPVTWQFWCYKTTCHPCMMMCCSRCCSEVFRQWLWWQNRVYFCNVLWSCIAFGPSELLLWRFLRRALVWLWCPTKLIVIAEFQVHRRFCSSSILVCGMLLLFMYLFWFFFLLIDKKNRSKVNLFLRSKIWQWSCNDRSINRLIVNHFDDRLIVSVIFQMTLLLVFVFSDGKWRVFGFLDC